MKLVIQIPAYNEETLLPKVLKSLPRSLPGVTSIEWLLIDDGSTDKTVQVAKSGGVEVLVSLGQHRGLSHAFSRGIEVALSRGADCIVNIDADHQYDGADIPALIKPILDGTCHLSIGTRPISQIKTFSRSKKALQKIGSFVVRCCTGTRIQDVPCGFRAFSKDLALRLNIYNHYTYTMEMIIHAQKMGFSMCSIPINSRSTTRQSRLVKSSWHYCKESFLILIRALNVYYPFRTFMSLGSLFMGLGILLGCRWLIFYMDLTPGRHIPSLILASIFLILGCHCWFFAFLADMGSVNRTLLEDIQYRLRVASLKSNKEAIETNPNTVTLLRAYKSKR